LAGAPLPAGVTLDGKSFAPQLRGQPGSPREWIFVQLGPNWYVRELDWKLNNRGELFDVTDAPFVEKFVATGQGEEAAAAARKRLQAVLDKLAPDKGKTAPADVPKAKRKGAKARKQSPQT
jgi:hypothetical protein